MHILFLTDNFPPEVNAPATRTFEHAREWVKAGHRVTVITCAPNFPKGKVFAGYRNRLWQVEEMEGIRVIRVWTFITANEGFLLRTLDFVSFMVSATIASLFVRKPDVVVATSPQFFTAVAGWMVGALKRRPFVFELRDLWPATIAAVGAIGNRRILSMLETLEMFLYRRSAAIVSVTNAFRRELIQRGVDADKIFVVTNGVDTEIFKPIPKDRALLNQVNGKDHFITGYIGTHGVCQRMQTLLDAFALLQNEEMRFVFIGDGAEKEMLQRRARDMGLKNIFFLTSLPKRDVKRGWSIFDAIIVPLRDDPLFSTVIPSKTFEAMAMGIPMIISVPQGELTEIVKEHKCGLIVPPENPEALANSIRNLANDPALRERLQTAALQASRKYSRKALASKMLDILEKVYRK